MPPQFAFGCHVKTTRSNRAATLQKKKIKLVAWKTRKYSHNLLIGLDQPLSCILSVCDTLDPLCCDCPVTNTRLPCPPRFRRQPQLVSQTTMSLSLDLLHRYSQCPHASHLEHPHGRHLSSSPSRHMTPCSSDLRTSSELLRRILGPPLCHGVWTPGHHRARSRTKASHTYRHWPPRPWCRSRWRQRFRCSSVPGISPLCCSWYKVCILQSHRSGLFGRNKLGHTESRRHGTWCIRLRCDWDRESNIYPLCCTGGILSVWEVKIKQNALI